MAGKISKSKQKKTRRKRESPAGQEKPQLLQPTVTEKTKPMGDAEKVKIKDAIP